MPEYILPRGMEAVEIKKRKRKHKKVNNSNTRQKKKNEDPLQSYDSVTLDDILDAEEDAENDQRGEEMEALPKEKPPALYGDFKKKDRSKGKKSRR